MDARAVGGSAAAARIADLRSPDLEGRREAVLAVPVGATEQHGPHLPLSTDTDIAEGLVAELARRRPDVVVAPAVAFGASGEHQAFAGTLSIGTAATTLLLVELGRSATETFDRVLLVSTHGGNHEAVTAATSRLRGEGRDVRAWSPRWDGDAHAGHVETSLMLALRPDRVAPGEATAGNLRPLGELLPELRRGGVGAVSANGVLGDPTTARADAGRALLDRAADDLEATVAAWETPAAAAAG